MNLNDIIDRFTLVSGLSMNDVSRYLPVIADCKSYMEERLPDGLNEAQKRRAAHACAVYAYYKLCITLSNGDIASFKAGELQINTGTPADIIKSAELMWAEERRSIADICDLGDDFGFRSVRI